MHAGTTELLSDEALACRAQEGDVSAFEELVDRYGKRLFHFLMHRTGNVHDAEDLAQKSFVKAWQGIGRFDPRYKFGTWLFTIAVRTAASWRRSLAPETGELVAENVEDRHRHEEEHATRDEARRLWELARQRLPEKQFTALALFYGEGMPVREVAAAMGLFETHVKVLLHRGRGALAREWRSSGEPSSPTVFSSMAV